MDTAPFLQHTRITADPARAPAHWILTLHGIMGSGPNWRTFARRFVTKFPAWGMVLVDLRNHGGSQHFPPPHTLDACARDLDALAREITRSTSCPVHGVLGHSFGGKVALALQQLNSLALQHIWIVDSMPGARLEELPTQQSHTTLRALKAVADTTFPSRSAFVQAMRDADQPPMIADWLAMSLRRTEANTFVFGLDLSRIESMIDDYYRTDLWSVVEHPQNDTRLHLVIGGRADTYTLADRDRALRAQRAHPERVDVRVFPEAGHWVQVEAFEETLEWAGAALATS